MPISTLITSPYVDSHQTLRPQQAAKSKHSKDSDSVQFNGKLYQSFSEKTAGKEPRYGMLIGLGIGLLANLGLVGESKYQQYVQAKQSITIANTIPNVQQPPTAFYSTSLHLKRHE